MRLEDSAHGGPTLAPHPGNSPRGRTPRPPSPWQGSRAGVFSAARLAVLRLRSGAALLPMVGIGILVAVILICIVPLFTLLGEDVQIQQALTGVSYAENSPVPNAEGTPPYTPNIVIQAESGLDASYIATAQPIVPRLEHHYLGNITQSVPPLYYLLSNSVILSTAGTQQFNPASPITPDSVFEGFDFAALGSHITVVQGHLPQTASQGCVIDTEMASIFHLKPGDTLTWVAFGAHGVSLSLPIAAVVQQTGKNDPWWNGLSLSPYFPSGGSDVYPILIPQSDFVGTLTPFHGVGLSMSQNWVFYTQPQKITASNAQSTVDTVGELVTTVNGTLTSAGNFQRIVVGTSLDKILKNILQQQGLLALPLYIIVAQVLGLALLFVAVMAGLLIEGQASDIATLKSRGLSAFQLLGVYATQGLLLGIICLLVGPLAASALALFLLKRFVPAAGSVDPSYLAHIATPGAVLVPALIGIGLGILMIAVAAFQAARLDVLAFRREQGRPSGKPFWQRYYLDLALVLLCIVGYVELGQFGGATVRAQLGGGANPLLLLAPGFLLLGGALLVLRLVPLVAALGARLAARGRGITSLLALAQVERNPGRYARMTLLLVLAVGLGLFALTFNASLGANIRDQAAYRIGADMVVRLNDRQVLSEQQQDMYRQLPGVQNTTTVLRAYAIVNPSQGNNGSGILAVDPATFAQVAGPVSWRSDYAQVPLATLMSELAQHSAGPQAGMPGHPMWAIISEATANAEHLKVGDAFAAQLQTTTISPDNFVVGAIVPAFPTLYAAGEPDGYFIVSLPDYQNASKGGQLASQEPPEVPNEYWFRLAPGSDAAFIKKLSSESGALGGYQKYVDLSAAVTQAESNPVAAGMRGLLLIGALTAAGLAVLGSLVQGILAANQRVLQFAILRTIGMSGRQILGQLLGEQLVVYFFGLAGGTVLGFLLTSATLPFLQFSEGTVDPITLGTPPYVVVFDGRGLLLFYLALLVAVTVALGIAGRYASAIGLGKALRLGAD